MTSPATFKAVLCGTLLSIACVLLVDLLPERRKVIYPASDLDAHVFVDPSAAGDVRWIDEQKYYFQCEMRNREGYTHCGINISLKEGEKNFDLSEYDAVYIRAKLHSSENWLRFFTYSWLHEYSQANQDETQIAQVMIRAIDINEGITIDLRQIKVPDWWIQRFSDSPPEYAMPHFEDTVAIGLVLGAPMELGLHSVELAEIAFVGKLLTLEQLYPLLLVAWVSAFLLVSLVNFLGLKKRLAQEKLAKEELSLQSERYKRLSITDPLTGTLNRNGLKVEIDEINKQGNSDESIALLILDLDFFKKINDEYGHDTGDLVLIRVAETIQSNIRSRDHLARWGGEEFLVVCRDTEMSGAYILGEKLRSEITTIDFQLDPPLKLTTSIGISSFVAGGDFEQAFKCADDALYRAKNTSRDCVVLGMTRFDGCAP